MKIYNTLTRQIEELTPIKDNKLNLFVCGPTVYDDPHIGHAKTYIQFDLLARYLRFLGYDLYYLQNITNIDDKIIKRSREKSVEWHETARIFEEHYLRDMSELNVSSVTQYARATDFIADIIRQVQTLLDKGHAYVVEDGVYFETNTFADYGKLSGRVNVEENDAESRIDTSEHKRNWNDFCLWKFSKQNEPVWKAPFGDGRPGWHIEDTAIAEHFFGPRYDMHGGAIDLIFPHHEDEIAQMESASGKSPYVKYWLHTGFLNIDSKKMSKSVGNFFTIREIIAKGYDPMAIRLLIIQSHYRSSLEFSFDNLDAAATRLKRLRSIAELRHQPTPDGKSTALQLDDGPLLTALDNDLNTAQALAVMEKTMERVEQNGVSKSQVDIFSVWLEKLDQIFGLNLLGSTPDIDEKIKDTIFKRQAFRFNSEWDKADQLRASLAEQGIGIRDSETGTIWYRL
jgi:cysteinyl-tRNA synthetase